MMWIYVTQRKALKYFKNRFDFILEKNHLYISLHFWMINIRSFLWNLFHSKTRYEMYFIKEFLKTLLTKHFNRLSWQSAKCNANGNEHARISTPIMKPECHLQLSKKGFFIIFFFFAFAMQKGSQNQ